MIAHKPQGPMQPAVGGLPTGSQMPMQQRQQQQQIQMAGHHHHHHHHHQPPHQHQQQQQQQHLLQEPANYYANANERFIQAEQQVYHQDPQASRYVPGRPQQQYQPQQVLQQDHHHHHQPQPQQQQQHAQTQVPPHQLPSYQTSAATTASASGYVEQPTPLNRFQGVSDQQLPPFSGVGVAGPHSVGTNNRGANQMPMIRVQQQMQIPTQPQQLQRPPSYANNQQPTPVRPIGTQVNRPMGRQPQQQQQNYQVYKASIAQSQITTPLSNQQHHMQSTTSSGYNPSQPGSAQSPHMIQQQHHQLQQQHHSATSTNYMGNTANTIDEYSSSSSNLLHQQLNRKSRGITSQQLPPIATSQAPMQRPPGVSFRPTPRNRPMTVAGPQQHVSRFCGDSNDVPGQVEVYPVVPEHINQGRSQVCGAAYYQQQPQQQPVSRGTHQHQPRPSMVRQPLPQHQQQQIPPPMPIDTTSHLLGNPTPPLTPIAPNAPYMRPPNANLVADEWQQLHQPQHGHVNHADHMQQPSASIGYNNGPSSSNHLDGSQKPMVGVANHHQSQQQRVLHGDAPPIASVSQPQRVMTTTMPKTSNNHAENGSAHYQSGVHNQSQQQQHQLQMHPNPANQVPGLQSSTSTGHRMISVDQQSPQQQANPDSPNRQQLRVLPPALSNQHQSRPIQLLTRLTLPLRDMALLGPFKLDHDAQFTSKVFHLNTQLFETLSKSMTLANPQAATVVQELQFRAYLVENSPLKSSANGESLLASNNQSIGKPCQWPELLQISVNQQIVQLDRSKPSHKAVDIFQFCQMGDNVLDIQVKGCYCTHEFVLEAVERPTLKAFMNSCFKSRLLSQDSCIQKLKYNFGSPGFLVQNSTLQSVGILNEYITEYNQGMEQTRAKISLRCPISARRMKTPTRGHNCKHLQCFDLENFLFSNSERSQWSCPVCSLSIAFNMLELDQHQMNIVQATMSDINLNTIEDVLVDCNGQWSAYYGIQQQPQDSQSSTTIATNTIDQGPPTTAKTNGTFHPQRPFIAANSSSPIHNQTSLIAQSSSPMNNKSTPMGSNLGVNWDNQQIPSHSPGVDLHGGLIKSSPIRRPPSAASQQPSASGRHSASGSPLAKRPNNGRYASPQPQAQPSPLSHSPSTPAQIGNGANVIQPMSQISSVGENNDDLSPLAAMERTIIQHEQQMGPPPFDPSSLASTNPLRNNSAAGQQASTAGQNTQASAIPPQSPIASPATGTSLASGVQQISSTPIQASPEARSSSVCGANFSPNPLAISSPASARAIPASPQQMPQQQHPQQQLPPQSPMQQQQHQSTNISTSTPATPSSALLVHGGPDTPATPSNSMQQTHHHQHSITGQSPPYSSTSIVGHNQQVTGVDHQPLSNGSASAGSITSTSTMTPSAQSLGSVGMGGDSRCNTAPLQSNPGLDDLVLPGSLGGIGNDGCSSNAAPQGSFMKQMGHHVTIDDKSEILMSKLMMENSESILHRNSELAIALEEAEWKQQLDRGKSEHLANFLNEPLMNQKHRGALNGHHLHNSGVMSSSSMNNDDNGSAKMLSGGLHPSDDEGNNSHGSSPEAANLDQSDQYHSGYLDEVDDGAGLPPDDSILDLFER